MRASFGAELCVLSIEWGVSGSYDDATTTPTYPNMPSGAQQVGYTTAPESWIVPARAPLPLAVSSCCIPKSDN